MTDEEQKKYFRDFILWQQEGLDIEKQHCLFLNFGVNMKSVYPQIRRVIMISNINRTYSCDKVVNLTRVTLWTLAFFDYPPPIMN